MPTPTCTLVFLLLYFSSLAAALWWALTNLFVLVFSLFWFVDLVCFVDFVCFVEFVCFVDFVDFVDFVFCCFVCSGVLFVLIVLKN